MKLFYWIFYFNDLFSDLNANKTETRGFSSVLSYQKRLIKHQFFNTLGDVPTMVRSSQDCDITIVELSSLS